MKQIAQYQDGRLELQEVPIPVAPPGGILVQTTHSVISAGTERMKVAQAGMNLLQKAMARPDQVRKVLDTARNLGWRAAWEKVRNRLQSPSPLGYSAAGRVVAVDPGQTRFRVGDRVACAGADCAYHAEYLAVPDLLAARVPEGVEDWQAAYTTLAAIALHAARQTGAGLGERVLVLGQGLIGLLLTNILAAQGARVMAADIAPGRLPLSGQLGAEVTVNPAAQDLAAAARHWTEGCGVDAVVVCASTTDNGLVEQAAAVMRDRGRLVIVGIARADLDWRVFYAKEIEVRYSRSYGPGRYDPAYEWGGADYPAGYVRWTEQRNFDACLHLMKTGALRLGVITTRRAPFEQALEVYRDLMAPGSAQVGVVLEYGAPVPAEAPAPAVRAAAPEAAPVAARIAAPAGRLDVLGAGNFARTMLLPHLKGRIRFGTVVNATALSAAHVQRQFGFERAAADSAEVLGAGGPPGALLIATRHHLHAPLVQAALAAGRHVFVEKPLCLTRAELEAVRAAAAASPGSVQVGFNRRFAPACVQLKEILSRIPGPKACAYRVAAGPLDPAHWSANWAESGGRVLGEACHFFDWFCYLLESPPVRVLAQPLGALCGQNPGPDGVTAQIEFLDGSSAQLIYSAGGDPAYPKETAAVFAAGFTAELVNGLSLTVWQGRKRRSWRHASKGHAEEMAAWAGWLQGQGPHPLPLEQACRSMDLTFAALESIHAARAIELNRPA